MGVPRIDRVRNEVVHRDIIEKELASRVNLKVLSWFYTWREWMSTIARRVFMAEVSGRRRRVWGRPRLDGWCVGGPPQQRNVGRGCSTMLKI